MTAETLTPRGGPGPAGEEPTRTRPRRFGVKHLVYLVVFLIIAYLVISPVFYLLAATFIDDTGFTLDAFVRAFGDPGALRLVANTVIFSVGSAIIALVLGTALAYLQARTDIRMKGLLFAASLMPLVLPAVVYAVSWVFLYGGEVGIVSSTLVALFGSSPLSAYRLPGMITASGLHLVPLVFLFMVPAFRAMDPSLEEAARVAGANWWTVTRAVTLKLIRPALSSSAIIVLVLGLESFEMPQILGESKGVSVFTSRIYFLMNGYPTDIGAAGAVSIALMAIAVLLMYGTGAGGGSRKEHQTVTGKAFKPVTVSLGKVRPIVNIGVFLYFLVAVVLPIVALLYVSLIPFYSTPSWDTLFSLSIDNYVQLSKVRGIGPAILNTVVIALVSATATMILTTFAAWFVVRSTLFGRRILEFLTLVPLVVPGLVLGLGMMAVYLRSPLPIYGTVVILMIAYITRFMTYGMRYASSAMTQIGNELEEAALVNRAGWLTSFRRILVPLAAPGILSGWIFVFLVSFRELASTVLLAGPNSEVLSVILFRQYGEGTFGVVAALSIVMVAILSLIVGLAYWIGSRFGTRIEL
ncbi:ABC transporter permease [Brevibacterium sp. VCM10]|uniref:ABC transporter permease n=1 Tax=Brevibacterium sp. VCM10 TaxID=1381751 RepID=UPI0004700F7B|nr:iron ABC transporter permease [Brevibacterium sp. VCM10]